MTTRAEAPEVRDAEFNDPRLVEVYDAECPWSRGAGFEIEQIYGGWQREPIGEGDGELLVMARRRASSAVGPSIGRSGPGCHATRTRIVRPMASSIRRSSS